MIVVPPVSLGLLEADKMLPVKVKDKGKFFRISNNELRASEGLKFAELYLHKGQFDRKICYESYKQLSDFLHNILLPEKLGK